MCNTVLVICGDGDYILTGAQLRYLLKIQFLTRCNTYTHTCKHM